MNNQAPKLKNLEQIEKQARAALPTFEELKHQTREPEGHMCEHCMKGYKEFNEQKRRSEKNWTDVYPVCKLTQDPSRKTGSLEEPDITLDEWTELSGLPEDEAQDEYDSMRMITDPVLWAAAMLGIVTDGMGHDDDGDPIDLNRWYQRWFWRCSSRYKSYRCGRRCFDADSVVWTDQGPMKWKTLADFNVVGEFPKLLTWDSEKDTIKLTDQYTTADGDVDDTYQFVTTGYNGDTVTSKHPVWVRKTQYDVPSWCNAEEVQEGWYVAVPDQKADELYQLDDQVQYHWERIKDIIWEPNRPSISCTVTGTGTVVNEMITHNTGKTFSMIVETLHFLWTNPGKRVLFIAPFEKQVIAFLTEIDKLVDGSDIEFNHRSKSKHTFEFPNGSSLESVMTGGNTAGSSGKSRGQKADLIVYDEACFIGQTDIEESLAILLDNPKCRVLSSSTPKGSTGWFYNISTDMAEGYKSFHLASHASPSITKIADAQLRNTMTTTAFREEVMAEFGEEGQGVFSITDIDKSLREYHLSDTRETGPLPGNHYVIGADWNGRAVGNHILVVEYVAASGIYRVVDKVIVSNDQYSVENTVKVILDLFGYWKASYVWVDAGYGDAYITVLESVGKTNKAFGEAFEPIAMQGSQEVINPNTGEVEKKPNKQFAISLLATRLEQGKLIMPFEEDYAGENAEDWGLVYQMKKYTIEKFSETGKPVYSKTADHTLVGFYLAVLAFHMKMTSLGRHSYDEYASVVRTDKASQVIDLTGGRPDEIMGKTTTARDMEKLDKDTAAKRLGLATNKGTLDRTSGKFGRAGMNKNNLGSEQHIEYNAEGIPIVKKNSLNMPGRKIGGFSSTMGRRSF